MGFSELGRPMREPYHVRVERFTTRHLMLVTAIVAFLVAVGIGRMGTVAQKLLAALGIGLGGGAPFALVALRLSRGQPDAGPVRSTKWQYTIPIALFIAIVFWVVACADMVKAHAVWDIAVLFKIVLIVLMTTAVGHAFEPMAGSIQKAATTLAIWIGAAATCIGLLLILRGPLIADLYDQNFFPMLPRPENSANWPSYSASLQRRYDTFEIPLAEFGVASVLALINSIIGYAFGRNRRRACAVAGPLSIAFMLSALLLDIEYGIAHVQVVSEFGGLLLADRRSLPVMATCCAFVIASSELAAGCNQSRSTRELQS